MPMKADTYGDVDPLDAWDDGDDVELKLAVLELLVATIMTRNQRDEGLRLLLKLERARADMADRLAAIRERLESV